jgi:hypothetical protein
MTAKPSQSAEEPLAVDEESESRRQVRQTLALPAYERLRSLADAYSLYVIGQRRRGRTVFGEDA